MAFNHGSLAKMAIDPAGGTSYTDVSIYLSSITLETEIDEADATALGNTSKQYTPSLEDGSFELEGFYDPTFDALLDSCKRVIATFRYRPAGDGSGLPEFTGQVIMTSYSIETNVEDTAMIEAEFQVTNAISRATQ